MVDKVYLSCGVLILIGICALGVLAHANTIRYVDADYFEENYLQEIEVKSAKVESPSVVIRVNRTEFLELLNNSSTTTIYSQFGGFYLFNEEMTIAYHYDVPLRYFWEQRGW